MEYVLLKSVGPKFLWTESRVQLTGEYFPPLQFHALIGKVEIGGAAIYHPFREFRLAISDCHLFGAQDQGQKQVELLAPFHDDFHGPRSDYVRQAALATTTEVDSDDVQKLLDSNSQELTDP
ncbi:uncharacterized protein TNCV_195001 [Trichonephila clavipes]|uniref:Uncharacterized protein n=1 Tax=Trichonephila clavipes TaxID=2585209 RepID=A0A8X6WHX0_TRICX|nr:uncharacterized protein TNCV_195001 [Trichonephila clavipes]